MKYRVHINPSEEFVSIIRDYQNRLSQYASPVPENVLHCTLMRIYMNPKNEHAAVKDLESITQHEFSVKADSFAMFDKNSFVIKLERSPELLSFHTNVIEIMRDKIDLKETPVYSSQNREKAHSEDYGSPDYAGQMVQTQEYGSPHYGESYNPHITIAKIKPNPHVQIRISSNRSRFSGKSWNVQEFYLSRKDADGWKEVQKFELQK